MEHRVRGHERAALAGRLKAEHHLRESETAGETDQHEKNDGDDAGAQRHGATVISTFASNAAWPPEKPKTSTAASGSTAAPDVRRLRPSQPSRIHTVPDGMRAVTDRKSTRL